MTESVPEREIHGSLWLDELMYGAEKAFKIREGLFDPHVPSPLGRDERQILINKRELARLQIEIGLKGTEVAVRELTREEDTLTGKLISYNFGAASITLRAGKRVLAVRFGEYHLEEGMVVGSPLIELETDQPYKY